MRWAGIGKHRPNTQRVYLVEEKAVLNHEMDAERVTCLRMGAAWTNRAISGMEKYRRDDFSMD